MGSLGGDSVVPLVVSTLELGPTDKGTHDAWGRRTGAGARRSVCLPSHTATRRGFECGSTFYRKHA